MLNDQELEHRTEEEIEQQIEEATQVKSEYGEEQIQVLEGLEAVRKRPGMYIGSTDSRGLHHLVYEIVDNSVDEALAGYCKRIDVTLHKDGSVSVRDDGRGFPVGIHPKMGRPAVEVCLTVLHAGGKFGGGGYKVSGGLHGVGASVVNALSKSLSVTVYQDGKIYQQEYARGKYLYDLRVIGETDRTGTTIRFLPDVISDDNPDGIFERGVTFDFDVLKKRLREMAFLNKGIHITFTDERGETPVTEDFLYEGGLREFVKYLNHNKEVLFPEPIYTEGVKDGILVEVAMQYNDSYAENIYTFVNNIVIDAREPFVFDERGIKPGESGEGSEIRNRLKSFPYNTGIWKEKYPELANILNDDPELPKYNTIKGNLAYNVPNYDVVNDVKTYGTFEEDTPVKPEDFVDYKGGDLTLKDDSEVFKKLPDFEKIDFKAIGVEEKAPEKTADSVLESSVALMINKPDTYVFGKKTAIDVPPMIVSDRTLVPVRFIAEAFGADVSWDDAAKKVTVKNGDRTIELYIDKAEITVNGTVSALDTAAGIIDGRTMLPLRAVVEALGKEVFWDARGLIIISDGEIVTADDSAAVSEIVSKF